MLKKKQVKKSTNQEPTIIIIPGNPGIGVYYTEFRDLLIEGLPYKDIRILDYKGFTLEKPDRLYSIEEELEYIKGILDGFYAEDGKDFILIGHSIGAWISLKILEQETSFSIQKLILIFPFIALDQKSSQQKWMGRLLSIDSLHHLVLGIYKPLLLLPKTIQMFLFRKVHSSMTPTARKVTEEYFLDNSHIPRSIFFLANTEFRTLTTEPDWNLIQKYRERLFFLYNDQDIWAPLSQREALVKRYNIINDLIPGRNLHDFCTSKSGNLRVSASICQFLGRP